jgi:hypothetical protein
MKVAAVALTSAPSAIADRRRVIERARRAYMQEAMRAYDAQYRADCAALRAECESKTGHHFQFSNFGPLGHAWNYCTYCGASKIEDRDT